MAAPALHRTLVLLVATNLAIAGCRGAVHAPAQDAGIDANEYDQLLATRTRDYSASLKAAALRLTGDAPTLSEIRQVANAPYEMRHAAYQALLRDYLARPAFARQMMYFWRDAFRIGGSDAL